MQAKIKSKIRETIIEMRTSEKTWREVANALNEMGIKTAKGLDWNEARVRVWRHNNIQRMRKKAKKTQKQSPKQTEIQLELVNEVKTPNIPDLKPMTQENLDDQSDVRFFYLCIIITLLFLLFGAVLKIKGVL